MTNISDIVRGWGKRGKECITEWASAVCVGGGSRKLKEKRTEKFIKTLVCTFTNLFLLDCLYIHRFYRNYLFTNKIVVSWTMNISAEHTMTVSIANFRQIIPLDMNVTTFLEAYKKFFIINVIFFISMFWKDINCYQKCFCWWLKMLFSSKYFHFSHHKNNKYFKDLKTKWYKDWKIKLL